MSKKIDFGEQNSTDPYTKGIIRSIVLEKIKSNQKLLNIDGINKLFDMILPLDELRYDVKNLNDIDKYIDNSLEKINKTIIRLENNSKTKVKGNNIRANDQIIDYLPDNKKEDNDTVNDLKTVLNELKLLKNQINNINYDETLNIFDKMMNQYMSKISDIVKDTCSQVFEKKIGSNKEFIKNFKNKMTSIDEKISQLGEKCDNLTIKVKIISEDIRGAEQSVEKISRLERMSRRRCQ